MVKSNRNSDLTEFHSKDSDTVGVDVYHYHYRSKCSWANEFWKLAAFYALDGDPSSKNMQSRLGKPQKNGLY